MIKQFHLENFQGIPKMISPELPNITVFIGRNDTGKTGLLKLLYGTVKAMDIHSRKQAAGHNEPFRKTLSQKLSGVFESSKNGLGSLVSKGAREKLFLEVSFQSAKMKYQEKIQFSFGESTNDTIGPGNCTESVSPLPDSFRALFVPPKEVLTAFKAIRASREVHFERGFDDTYQDLIRALSISTWSGRAGTELDRVKDTLEGLLGGVVKQVPNTDDFTFRRGRAEFEMSQTAEGIKKIGLLTTLISNRQINPTTVLFMDEPETTLHPYACRELVRMLVLMAQSGMQIFLASHSYFILKQLHIEAKRTKMPIQCCSLERTGSQEPVHYVFSDLRDGLPQNGIVDESMEMYRDDIKTELNLS